MELRVALLCQFDSLFRGFVARLVASNFGMTIKRNFIAILLLIESQIGFYGRFVLAVDGNGNLRFRKDLFERRFIINQHISRA